MPNRTQTGSVQGAVWTTAYVDSLPDSSFAFVDGDTRKLPYKDKDGKVDLPHVRNALARLNQTQGISDEEKTKIRTKLQSALKNTKAADDMVLRTVNAIQASDGDTATLPTRVHLLRDGDFNTQKYGEVPIAASDLFEMKFNFDRGVGMANEGETGIPIDFAHLSNLNAAGWIRGLEVVQADSGTELWGTDVEWSDSGKSALLGKEYKCLSSDFYPGAFGEWVDSESGITAKNVIVGAALTNRPMFTGNKPVIASDGEAEATGIKTVIYVSATNENNKKETSMPNLDELRVKAAADLTGAEGIYIAQHASELSEDERKKFGLEAAVESEEDKKKREEAEKAAAVKASNVTGNEGVVSIQASELKAMTDGMAAMQASIDKLQGERQQSDHDSIEASVKTHAARGAIKADSVEGWTKMIEAADADGRKMLMSNLESLSDNPLLGRKFGSQQTEGSAAMDVEAEIAKKVSELVASSEAKGEPIDAFKARKQVLAADSDLAARSTEAARAALGSFNPFEAAWGTNAAGIQGVNPEVTNNAFAK